MAAPLSGSSAESGADMVDGAQLAVDYLNENGGVAEGPLAGKKFAIEAADDQESTETATTLAARFADDDSLFAMTGFITSGQAQAAGVVANRYNLPIIVSFASADFLTEEADNLVVVSSSVANYARVSADFATTELGAKTVGSVAGDYSFLDSYYEGLDSQLDLTGGQSVSRQTYPAGASDYSTLITNVKNANPDVVMSGAFQSDAGKLATQVRGAGMQQDFVDFLGEGWGSSFADSAGSSIEQGRYFEMSPADKFPEPGSLLEAMDTKFEQQHGKRMPTSAMHTFDSILSISAMIDAGASSKEELLDAAVEARGDGVLGPIEFTDDLTPKERIGTVALVTGPGSRDRELQARYSMKADGTVEKR
ncbi:ABC transporter substrate-binding protein [Rhodococcus fascians]|nr:ABC transporter substrate-binding protein [Rhodococcus fascians]MBY4238353.1 ABC transporter substrate-binding protein [Rhodococcus fascians]MBY4254266.1 ABC transporter substrate-binding protein [Rhodococcus fascians]MBY4269647.1 ABC transporter substrate-binding protein [Rhodococcus fascians]